MEILDLNRYKKHETDYFSLWGIDYKYTFSLEDKTYFKNTLEKKKKKKNLFKTWIEIFKKILKRENNIVVVVKEDIVWLLSYFTYKFL